MSKKYFIAPSLRTLPILGLLVFLFFGVALHTAHGQTATLSASPDLGYAPFNDIDLEATVSGISGGGWTLTYKFDCTNDGSFELTVSSGGFSYAATDLCDYGASGTHTAKVTVDYVKGGTSGTVFATDTVTVYDTPPPDTTSWVAQTSGITTYLRDVYFVDANTGWAVGQYGTILKTTNGGTTWTSQNYDTAYALFAVQFIDANTGWTVGTSGKVLKTTNGGTTWTALSSGTTGTLETVFFVDANTGWIGGISGTATVLRKTTNGGTSWSSQTASNPGSIEDFHFLDANTGWAVIAGGSWIMKTTNGGSTWSDQTGAIGNAPQVIQFVDANTGWAVGLSSGGYQIQKTTNGGTTWAVQPTPGTALPLYGGYFVDANTGYVSGLGGRIFVTTNGGTTWASSTSGTAQHLYGLFCINADTCWVVGDGGKILKRSSAVAFNYSLSNGGNKSVTQGQSVTSTITATLVSGTSQSVSYTASGLPSGATASFSPTSCTPTCSTTMTISTLSSTTPGDYTVTVTGTATGGLVKTSAFVLTVNAIPFTFSLSNGGDKSVVQGQSVTNTITATALTGAAQSVSYSASGLPTNATTSFSPTSCAPTCSTIVTISTLASTPAGTYTITITGTATGGATDSTAFVLSVSVPPPVFTLANSGDITLTQGNSSSSTITTTLVSGSAESVSFSASGLPTGATASFSPTSCTPTCSTTMTISTLSSTVPDNYTITVTGTSTGGVTATTAFVLTVNAIPFDFSLSNGVDQSLTQGESASQSITATLVSGTAQSVSFTASSTLSGATISFSPTSCTPTCSTTVTITTSASTSAGNYTITIIGTATGGTTKTTAFVLAVGGVVVPPSATIATTTITTASGGSVSLTVQDTSAVTLTIPANAITGTATADLTVAKLTATSSLWVDAPSGDQYVISPIDITVAGGGQGITTFALPVTVRFTWTDSQAAGIDVTGMKLGWYDTNNAWQNVTSQAAWDFASNTVAYASDHLTRFALVTAASAATPAPSPGGGITVPSFVTIQFYGQAYPGARLTLFMQDVERTITQLKKGDVSSSDGKFQIEFKGLRQGVLRAYGLIITDKDGLVAQVKTFATAIVEQAVLSKYIFATPTIRFTKAVAVKKGESFSVRGYAAPSFKVEAEIDGKLRKEKIVADAQGVYSASFSTADLALGTHTIRVRHTGPDGAASEFSAAKIFVVSSLAVPSADFNQDGKINISDWSIFLNRWGSKEDAVRNSADLNGDQKLNISDFGVFVGFFNKPL